MAGFDKYKNLIDQDEGLGYTILLVQKKRTPKLEHSQLARYTTKFRVLTK